MVIYLDTSAAMKLVRPERHSSALSRWLGTIPDLLALSSVLIEVELVRAARRVAPELAPRADEVLRGIASVTLSPAVRTRAAGYPDPFLRSLDALHLATAEHVADSGGLDALVAYDERLLDAAALAGLPVAAPGLRPDPG